jgi:hypothetical protein
VSAASAKCFSYNYDQNLWDSSGALPFETWTAGFDSSESWGLGIVYTKHLVHFCLYNILRLFSEPDPYRRIVETVKNIIQQHCYGSHVTRPNFLMHVKSRMQM